MRWDELIGFLGRGKHLVVTHLLDVFYVRLDRGKEGFELGAAAKTLEMAFFGVPFDAQDVMIGSFRAVRELIGQTMT